MFFEVVGLSISEKMLKTLMYDCGIQSVLACVKRETLPTTTISVVERE